MEVLLRIYAKCLDGGTDLLRQRVQRALGHGSAASSGAGNFGGNMP